MMKSFLGLIVLLLFHNASAFSNDLRAFKIEDVKTLKANSILGKRVRINARSSAMAVETCFLINGKPKDVRASIMKWDPSKHKNSGVILHRRIGKGISEKSFSDMQLTRARRRGVWMLNQTGELRDTKFPLNLSNVEANELFKIYEGHGKNLDKSLNDINKAWRTIIASRSLAFKRGGLNKLSTYDNSGRSTSISTELKKVISGLPALKQDFDPILRRILSGGGNPDFYFEHILIQGDMAFLAGCYLQSELQNKLFLSDMQFYVSHTIYGTFVLYQLEPYPEDSSKTLVWRLDIVLAPPIIGGGGMERMASANVLLQEVKKVVKLLHIDLN
ncbi:MAG: hypothetical protein AAGA18_07435 [Verrucomicrobiota bacterium]